MRILAVSNIYPTPEHPTQGTFVEQQVKGLRQLGLTVEVMMVDRAAKGYRAYLGLSRRIKEVVSQTSPHLVHVMYGGVLAKAVTDGIRGCPLVVSFCGSDLLGEKLPGIFRKLAVAYGVRCSRFAAPRATGIIVKSRNLYDALPVGLDTSRILVLPNGVDLQRFQPMNSQECRERLGWRGDRFHILFPANEGTPRKRLWLAQAAVAHVNSLGVPAELHALRRVPHSDVPLWLNASDCVILTSEHEGSPNIIKEALACNRPVVSVDVGDVGERISGIEGCYLSEGRPEPLARCLGRVYDGPRQVDSRPRIQAMSLEKTAEKLRSFYESIIERWHRQLPLVR